MARVGDAFGVAEGGEVDNVVAFAAVAVDAGFVGDAVDGHAVLDGTGDGKDAGGSRGAVVAAGVESVRIELAGVELLPVADDVADAGIGCWRQ